MNIDQLKEFVIIPTLDDMGLHSDAAVNLLVGTTLQESLGGKYIHQVSGPALGIYQMEPHTYEMLTEWYMKNDPARLYGLLDICFYNPVPDAERLMMDIQFATGMARLFYFNIKTPLPKADDIEGLANYWKKYYNTEKGKGKVEEFIDKYEKYT